MRGLGQGAGAGGTLGVWRDGMGLGRVGCRIHIKSH